MPRLYNYTFDWIYYNKQVFHSKCKFQTNASETLDTQNRHSLLSIVIIRQQQRKFSIKMSIQGLLICETTKKQTP